MSLTESNLDVIQVTALLENIDILHIHLLATC